jgi:uncharacterized protein YccT (UPF0319 family)
MVTADTYVLLFQRRGHVSISIFHNSLPAIANIRSGNTIYHYRNIQLRPADIQPIIVHLHYLGPDHSMSRSDLTVNTCWLLEV